MPLKCFSVSWNSFALSYSVTTRLKGNRSASEWRGMVPDRSVTIPAALSVEFLFFQVIAVCAVKITDWPVRLGHDMKWLHENRFLVLRRRAAPKTKPTSSTRGALYLNQDPIGIC